MKKLRRFLPLAAEGATAVLSMIGTVGHCRLYGISMLQFYTVDSNIFLMVMCIISLLYRIRLLRGKTDEIPAWVGEYMYFSVCTVTVTFLVVIAVLTPMSVSPEAGFFPVLKWFLLGGERLYHHLLCPLLAIAGAILWEEHPGPMLRCAGRALIPTIIYGVPVLALNLLKCMEGPYEFLMVYRQSPIMSIILCTAVLLIAWGVALGIHALYGIRAGRERSAS